MTHPQPNPLPPIEFSLPRLEAFAFAQMLKRFGYDDAAKYASRFDKYDGRCEQDVIWCAIQMIERQLKEQGIAPR